MPILPVLFFIIFNKTYIRIESRARKSCYVSNPAKIFDLLIWDAFADEILNFNMLGEFYVC